MHRPLLTMLLACALGASTRSGAHEAPPAIDASSTVEAIAMARHDVKLSFTIAGRVSRVLAAPGDAVRVGQAVVALDDRDQRARVAHLEQRASSDAEVRAAQARLRLALIEEQRARDALARNAAAPFEVERHELETALARINLEQAEQRRAEAAHELELARLRLDEHVLRSPIDGVIEDVPVREGESVEPLAAAARVVATDVLRIDARVPTARTVGMRVGDAAYAMVRLGRERTSLKGRIVHLASVADAASDTRLVRVEADNSAGVPAGVRMFVVFGGGAGGDEAD